MISMMTEDAELRGRGPGYFESRIGYGNRSRDRSRTLGYLKNQQQATPVARHTLGPPGLSTGPSSSNQRYRLTVGLPKMTNGAEVWLQVIAPPQARRSSSLNHARWGHHLGDDDDLRVTSNRGVRRLPCRR
jgi:hypothetical protein